MVGLLDSIGSIRLAVDLASTQGSAIGQIQNFCLHCRKRATKVDVAWQ